MNRGRSVQSLHTGTPEAFEIAYEGTCVENMMTEQDFSKEESTIILIILYYLIRCKSAMQPSPIELKELRNSCLTFHKGSNGGKNKGRVYIRCCFSYPVTFLFLEKYTTHSQKFPAGSPHGLDFETLIRDTLGPALFSLLYSIEASGNKLVKTGETVGFTNTAAA